MTRFRELLEDFADAACGAGSDMPFPEDGRLLDRCRGRVMAAVHGALAEKTEAAEKVAVYLENGGSRWIAVANLRKSAALPAPLPEPAPEPAPDEG